MKRLTSLAALFAMTTSLALADQLIGWVTDRKCAMSGNFIGAQHKDCVQNGQPLVFVNEADKKIYVLTDADKARDLVGQKVVLEGAVKAEEIQVQSVRPVSNN